MGRTENVQVFQDTEMLCKTNQILIESTKKDVLFCKQWIVIPAFYRDVNYRNVGQGKISNNELTDLYCKLLKYTNMYKSSTEFEFLANSTIGRVQDTLVELYDYFKQKIEKKRGLIRRSLLGKSVDYGCRAVISSPTFGETYTDNPVDFVDYLYQLHVLRFFHLFYMKWEFYLKNYMKN